MRVDERSTEEKEEETCQVIRKHGGEKEINDGET